MDKKDYNCSCGRNAEVEVGGVYMCWEKYLQNEPEKWKDKYRYDIKPRHENNG